ncbi:TIGR04222 domain-containing membrane protein [Chitinimonas koreensis]|uniref:TIGR04222 domain-containing membrane protein n=1 Tax=Chitinimonas koreensis TaxID=356302 RepID=UPI000422C412|nr:TIGR04222 domain-containing membrane protein [Chitinimonas koreensis]QNM96493.1 TIGR04222 domain-containing membrane protein [Chitinimonas koreensis]
MKPDPQPSIPAAGLSPEQAALYRRIAEHPFDRAAPLENFSAKLARQNGWTPAYARRVTAEYRRFVLIALESGHVASPSDAVDQAWHLHLGYTRDYWERFCPEVLGRTLHHEPAAAGTADAARHAAQYRQTLASYRRLFGESPPADIWPTGRAAHRFQRVDLAQHLLLPRPTVRPAWRVAAAVAPLLLLAGCSALGGFDVLGYSGPAFLAFYLPLLLIYLLLRPWLGSLGSRVPIEKDLPLEPAEAAYLADGSTRLVETTVLGLLQKQQLTLDEQGRLNRNGLAGDFGLAPFERAVLAQVGFHTEPVELHDRLDTTPMRRQLLARGLLQRPGLRAVDLLGIALWLLGAVKAGIGISLGRPVIVLLLVLGALAVVGIIVFVHSRRVRPSPAGRAALKGYERRTRKLTRGSDEYALQRFAVIGSAALAGSAWAILQRYFGLLPPGRQDGGSDNGSSSSNSDSTCSSGGDGGGGGCGGCGGGGGD